PRRANRYRRRQGSYRRSGSLAALPFTFHGFGLLEHFLYGVGQRRAPCCRAAPSRQVMLAPGVDDDFGDETVFLALEHDLHRQKRVGKTALELFEPGLDERFQSGSDLDLTARERETHEMLSTAPCADWKWESSALRGTWRSCAAREPSLRAGEC